MRPRARCSASSVYLVAMLLPCWEARAAEEHGPHGHGKQERSAESAQHHAHSHRFELGLSAGVVYLPQEQEVTAGLHLHAVFNILASRFGVGLGYERLLDDHGHNAIGVILQLRIIDEWSVAVSPGVAFADAAPADVTFAAHVETAYEFPLGENVHLGPVLEVAFDTHEVHLTGGAHLGVGF